MLVLRRWNGNRGAVGLGVRGVVIVVHENGRRVVDVRTTDVVRHSPWRHLMGLRDLGWERGHLAMYLGRCSGTTFGFDVVDTGYMR